MLDANDVTLRKVPIFGNALSRLLFLLLLLEVLSTLLLQSLVLSYLLVVLIEVSNEVFYKITVRLGL